MPAYYDSQNNAYILGERIGGGGEGTVYSCEDFKTVAKIYHEPITGEKAEKLRWMAANKNAPLLKVAAWVIDVLHDAPNGQVVGFIMPNVKAKEIHELYSLKSRRVHFPEATWHFLVHSAANVARAFHSLHKNAHVMGDVNHGNCVVLADGTVKLIDCDSYSVKTDKLRYSCEVGVATHLAPELQGVNLSDVERENKHDNFGLAVIIFQLLFLGRHPFAGNYLGAEDKSIEECIRELRFAYGDGAEHRKVKQPPGTLSLASVSPRVALMFERAFLTEDRPEPREWIEALEDLENNLEQCGLHPGHLYFNQLVACPWCEIEAQTGLMLFPFITSGKHLDGEKPFNIFTVENLIANLGISENLPALPPKTSGILPPPSKEIIEAKKESYKLLSIVVSAQIFVLILLIAMFGVGTSLILGVFLMAFAMIFFNNSNEYTRWELKENLADANVKWANLERNWTRNAVPHAFDNDLAQIRQKLQNHQQLQQQSARQLKHLHDDVLRREVFAHLRSQSIAETEKFGIPKVERQFLGGKGVKTAAEISENHLRNLKKIDDESIRKLIEWRGKLESDFSQTAATKEILQSEETHFIGEITRERRRIEQEIERLLMILRAGSVHIRKQQQELFSKSEELAKYILQAKSDAAAMGDNVLAMIALVVITFLTPFIGGIINTTNSVKSDPPRYSQGNGGYATSMQPVVSTKTYPKDTDLEIPDENITDAKIAALPDGKIDLYANNLYSQSIDLAYNYPPDYTQAERKIRLAIRLKPKDITSLNHLGYVLYQQQRYGESLKYLNQSLAIEKKNDEAKLLIAINYLKQERFKEARRLLTGITEGNGFAFEGFYNLGLAYIGLNDYASAAKALQSAIKIGKDDVDSHYELGICYDKLGDTNGLYQEYEELLRLNNIRAEKLKQQTNIKEDIHPNKSY